MLANVVLHELDRSWEDHSSHIGQLIRYADDAVVVGRTQAQAREALYRVRAILKRLKLTLHPDKTKLVSVGNGRQGFDFLGFECRMVEAKAYRGKRYFQCWPSRRAMQRVRDRIKAITAPRHRLPEPIEPIVAEVNRMVRGWGAYFRAGNSTRKFRAIDRYVRERLVIFLVNKARRGKRARKRDSWALLDKLGVYRLQGTVQWATATSTAVR